MGVHRLSRREGEAAPIRHQLRWLAAVVVAVAVLELVIAATTLGTEDVRRWSAFAAGIADVGPWRVYGQALVAYQTSYNHPPLAGDLLWLTGGIAGDLRTFAFVLRIPGIAASALTPFLVFELVRRRRSADDALLAAAAVALSPALIAISGFHGNTDTVVVALSLASVYLLVDRRAPAWSGVVIALAVGLKLVPVVVIPVLLVGAWQLDRRAIRRFVTGAAVVSLLIWIPALVTSGGSLVEGVLGYAGGVQPWGLGEVADRLGADGLVVALRGAGRVVAVLVAAGLPAWLLWRSPDVVVEAAAISFTALLAFSSGFGMQYLAWAIAPAYLLHFGWATGFNVMASWLAWQVYTRWSGGLPWALSSPFVGIEVLTGFIAWVCLVGVVVTGIRTCFPPSGSGALRPKVPSRA